MLKLFNVFLISDNLSINENLNNPEIEGNFSPVISKCKYFLNCDHLHYVSF